MNQQNNNQSQPTNNEIQPLLNAFNNRNFDEAIKVGKILLDKYPNAFFIHNLLGSCYANLGQIVESIVFFRKAYDLEPGIPETCSNLAMALQQQKKYDEAVMYFEKSLKLKNDIPEIHYNFAVCLANSGKNEAAINSYKKAIELKPDFSFAYYNLGLLLWGAKSFKESIDYLSKANTISPKNAEILASLGAVNKSAGNLKEAEEKTREAIKLKIDPKFKFNLATIMRDQGILDEARKLYEETILIDSNFVEAYNNLGEVLRDQGKSDVAKDFFQKALEIDENFSMANYNLGILYQDANQLDKALNYFNKSKVFDWQQRICYCAYKSSNFKLFSSMFDQIRKYEHHSPLIASISTHYSLNNKIEDEYNFCPNPFDFINNISLDSLSGEKSTHRDELIDDLNKTEIAERKQGRLINGIQSAGNLFKRDEKSFRLLAGLILVEIDNYISKFKQNSCDFINSFPEKPEFQSSWYVKMKQSGHLTSHIHETGWLSGVLYLKIPIKKEKPEEGSIEFGFDGDSYPKNLDLPKKKFNVEVGDL
ncbi:MAG: hypothetical protein CBD16_00600, partial [Betaproteobacteria bacterium TMED156]